MLASLLGSMSASLRRLARTILGRTILRRPDVPFMEVNRCRWFNIAMREIMPGFAVEPDDLFVDVGCGDGGTSLFAGRCGAEVIAVDILEHKVESVRQKLLELQERAARQPAAGIDATPASPVIGPRAFAAIVSDANPLPLASGCATKVVCQEVLEHVDHPANFMSELVRIGGSGARYLLSVPDPIVEDMNKRIVPQAYWEKPNHQRIFQRDEFARLVINAGLRIEGRTYGGFYWSMWWMLFWSVGKPVPAGGYGAPVLKYWNFLWAKLISDPKSKPVVDALENTMPKYQYIVAVKD